MSKDSEYKEPTLKNVFISARYVLLLILKQLQCISQIMIDIPVKPGILPQL